MALEASDHVSHSCPSMDFVKINCRYGDIDFAASFNILHDILSGPLDLLGLTALALEASDHVSHSYSLQLRT
jgi:hypothetical protein